MCQFSVCIVLALLIRVSFTTQVDNRGVYREMSLSIYENQIPKPEMIKNHDVRTNTVIQEQPQEASTITITSVMKNVYSVTVTLPDMTTLIKTITSTVLKPYNIVLEETITIHPEPSILKRTRHMTSTVYITSVKQVVKQYLVTEERIVTLTQTDVSTVRGTFTSLTPQYITEYEVVPHTSYVPVIDTVTTVSYRTTTKTHFQEVGVTRSQSLNKVLLQTEWVTETVENLATISETVYTTKVVSECPRHYFQW
ncbi:uncharacterized protein LOC143035855 [Oratosquilla oratoria]|uniref:uncharacterized protein LOC143035855 n=1 Tax=Oratosquilla oratoria TaxID=337810 RepID=UPI003F77639F